MTMIVSCSCYSIAILQLLFISTLAVSGTAGVVNSDTSSTSRKPTKLHVLVYETSKDAIGIDTPSQRLVDQINNGNIERMVASIFGQSTINNNNVVDKYGFAGYGSKFHSVIPVLTSVMEDSTNDEYDNLVVISDSRDVLLNNPFNDDTYSKELVNEFKVAYDTILSTKTNGIIISAEAQCCVSALTHVPLGGYYNIDGTRKVQACSSGSSNCLWAGDDKAIPWENFMKQLMIQSTTSSSTYDDGSSSIEKQYDDIYLNSGLMVGTPTNLLRIINKAQINMYEDDQAVWTDYMYHNPYDIVLDYSQQLFGNNRGGVSITTNSGNNGCVFHQQQKEEQTSYRLIHSITNTQPLFIHSPGQYFICHEQLSLLLNVPQVSSIVRRTLTNNDLNHRVQCNYGRFGTSNCTTITSESTNTTSTNTTTTTNLLDSLLSNRTSTTTTLAPVPAPVPVSVSTPISLADLLTGPKTTPTISAPVPVPVPVLAPTSALYSFLQQAKVPVASVPASVPVALVVAPVASVPVQTPTTIAVPISTYLTEPIKYPPGKSPPIGTTKGNVRGGSK